MRFLKLIALMFTLQFLLACSEDPDAMDSEGHAIHLSDYQGKWLVVNYWAEWCHACVMEMPDLVKLQAQYPNKVALIGVNFDGKSNDYLQHFSHDHHLNYLLTSHLDPHRLGLDQPMATVPTTVLIAPDGKIDRVVLQPKTLAQWKSLLTLE